MSTLLLATRLNIPPLSANLVPGPDLIERLNAVLRTRDAFFRAQTLTSAMGFQDDTGGNRPVRRGLR